MKVVSYELEQSELEDIAPKTLERLGSLAFIAGVRYRDSMEQGDTDSPLQMCYSPETAELYMLGVPSVLRETIESPMRFSLERYSSKDDNDLYIAKARVIMTEIAEDGDGTYPVGISFAYAYDPARDISSQEGSGVTLILATVYQSEGSAIDGSQTWYEFDDSYISGEVVASTIADILEPAINGTTPDIVWIRNGLTVDS